MDISTEQAINPKTKTIKNSLGEFTLKPFTLMQIDALQEASGNYQSMLNAAEAGSAEMLKSCGVKPSQLILILLCKFDANSEFKEKVGQLSILECMQIIDAALEVSQIKEIKTLFLSAVLKVTKAMKTD